VQRVISCAVGLVTIAVLWAGYTRLQLRAQEPPTFRSHVDVVNVTLTVTDHDGRFVSGLGKSDFAVFEDGNAREIQAFADESAPVSLGILLDASGSMTAGKLGLARESITRLVTHDLHAPSEWFLGRFGYSLVIAREWTTDPDDIVQPLRETRATGDTALYDTVALAIPLVKDGQFAKKSLLVVSDGGETKSLLSIGDVQRAIGERDVRVYAIGVDARDGGRSGRLNVGPLRQLATEIRANRRITGAHFKRNIQPCEMRLELSIVGMDHVRMPVVRPQGPRELSHGTLVVHARDRNDLLRFTELRFERADVLVDLLVFDDVAVHLGQSGIAVGDAPQRDDELQKIRVRLLPERLLRLAEQVVQQRG